MQYTRIEHIPLLKSIGESVAVKGHLRARGDFMAGGECWIAPGQCSLEGESDRVILGPDDLFQALLDRLDLRGGGDFILSEPVSIIGVVDRTQDGAMQLRVEKFVAHTQFGEIEIEIPAVE